MSYGTDKAGIDDEFWKIFPRVDGDCDLDELKRVKGERVPGTCEWLLEQKEYRMWLSELGVQLLCLEGDPGTGKTMMSTFLIEQIQKRADKYPEKVYMAFFFCKNTDDDRNNAASILCGLIYRRLQQMNYKVPKYIEQPFKEKGSALFGDVDALWEILMNMVKADHFEEVFFVIDGIDECKKPSRQKFLQLIQSRRDSGLSSPNMRFLFSSRPTVNFGPASDSLNKIRVDTEKISDDLPLFIATRVDETAETQGWGSQLTEDVREHLLMTAGGTFLYVGLFLEQVKQLRSIDVEHQLSENKLPGSLQDIYARILREMPTSDRPAAAWVLKCVVSAVRPLTIEEFAVARCLEIVGLQERTLPEWEELESYMDVLELCRSLIVLSGETVTIIHQTLKDFLTSSLVRDDPELKEFYVDSGAGNWLMFKICAAVLDEKALDGVADQMERQVELDEIYRLYNKATPAGCVALRGRCACMMSRPGQYWQTVRNNPVPLVSYAARYWETHAIRAAEGDFVHEDQLKQMPPLRPQLARCWMRAAVEHAPATQVKLMQELVPNACNNSNWAYRLHDTPLICAAKHGNPEIVEAILNMGVFDVAFRDWRGRTALIHAAKAGHLAVTEQLLETGQADVNCKDRYGWTAYRHATNQCNEPMKDLLWDAENMRFGKMEMLHTVFSKGKSRYTKFKKSRSDKKIPKSNPAPATTPATEVSRAGTPSLKSYDSSPSLPTSDTASLTASESGGSLRPPTTRLPSRPSKETLRSN
ncbi:MAG: hypothetical protein Q9227_004636 [Pyrenula ochraceoflavens]